MKIIKLDLSSMYEYIVKSIACNVLFDLLKHYEIDVDICVNFSPDTGVQLYDKYMRRVEGWLAKRLSTADNLFEIIKEYAESRGLDVVELYDGYERAWAVISRKE